MTMNQDMGLDKADSGLQTADSRSLADRVYSHVIDCIQSSKWVSGDVIDRKELAADLGVSLAPVGEALIRLRAEGFLETTPRRHTQVRIVRPGDVRGQFALRMALERQAVAMSHGEPVRAMRERLIELAEEVDRFPPKHPSAWPSEIAFHQALVDLAECPALSEAYVRVMRRNFFYAINSAHVVLEPKTTPPNQHSLLIDGLCTDDPDEADRVIMLHHASDRQAMLRIKS